MKLEKSELSRKINQLKGIVQMKSPVDALRGILCMNGYLIASNTELTIKTKLKGVDEETEESFIIPDKAFDFINNLPLGEVELVLNDSILTIKMDKIKNNFSTYSVESFAYKRENIETEGMTIQTSEFINAVSHVTFAVATAYSNPVMTGMLLKCEGGKLDFVGLDGHMIAWDCIDYDNEFEMIIPKTSIDKLIKLDISGSMSIAHDENGAVFKTDEFEVYTRLIQGKYFDYKKMFSAGEKVTIVERKKFMEAINRAKLCGSSDDKKPVVLTIKDSTIHLAYKSAIADYQEDVETQMDIEEGLTIGFNPVLLLESLKAFDCENVALEFNNAKAPAVIKAEDSDMTVMVLPVSF